jgi:predicted RNA-binding Zn-ribbon protein involved in translation (DUF1610 family)
MSEQIGVISIPTDEEGFVLLQCPLCGELFKLRTEDIKREYVIEIWCPCCGLKSESYFTKDVLDLALKKAENYATDRIYEELKQLERKSRHSLVTIKAGKKPTHREEYPVRSGIENMKITHYICCNRDAKTKAMYKMCGSYCPFCGVRYDEY